MLIVITGTPGTGKTAIAEKLARKMGYKLIDIKCMVEKNKIYKIKKGEKEVDLKKLRKMLLKEIKKLTAKGQRLNTIIENHLLCEFRLPADFIFVFRCYPKILKRRLSKRNYRKDKLNENLLAEMLDYCYLEAEKNYGGKQIEVDTSKRSLNNTVDIIIDTIKRRRKKIDEVDYRDQLRRFAVDKHGRNTG